MVQLRLRGAAVYTSNVIGLLHMTRESAVKFAYLETLWELTDSHRRQQLDKSLSWLYTIDFHGKPKLFIIDVHC